MRWNVGLPIALGLITAGQPVLMAQHARGTNIPEHVVRPPSASPSSYLGGRPYPIRTDLPTPTGLIAPAASYTGIAPGALRPLNENRYNRGGFVGGYAGYYGTPFLPYLDTGTILPLSTFPGFSEQAAEIDAQNSARADAQAQQAMAERLYQLSGEVRQLQESRRQADSSAQTSQSAAAPLMSDTQPPQAPIVVVLQSGSRVSVQSYAIMNGTIWDFSKQPVHKIPVSTVDLGASRRATEEIGGEFPSIASSQ